MLTAAIAAPPRVLVPCDVTAVKDGDTIEATIRLPYPPGLVLENQDVRLQGFDAWESSKRRKAVNVTDTEVRKGKVAAAALAKLVIDSEAAYLAPVETPQFSYGRQEGFLYLYDAETDTLTDVAAWMAEQGHCRPAAVGAAQPDDNWRDDVIIPAGD